MKAMAANPSGMKTGHLLNVNQVHYHFINPLCESRVNNINIYNHSEHTN